MVAQNATRRSGKTAGEEVAAVESDNMETPIEPDKELALTGGALSHPESKGTTLTPSFQRMSVDALGWNEVDREVVSQMLHAVDHIIKKKFRDVYDLFDEINLIVREPVVSADGEVQTDPVTGALLWQRNEADTGYVEDWTRFTYQQQEHYLMLITTNIFRWEQEAENLWGEALFSKSHFEEAFSHGYEELANPRATIEDRTARARIRAAENRYRAVYLSFLSRRAQACVRSADRMGQRLKDLITNR